MCEVKYLGDLHSSSDPLDILLHTHLVTLVTRHRSYRVIYHIWWPVTGILWHQHKLLEHQCARASTMQSWGGSSVDWEPSLETWGSRFKSCLSHFPAVLPWASHLTPIAYPYHSSALEPDSIGSKTDGKGLKKVTIFKYFMKWSVLFCKWFDKFSWSSTGLRECSNKLLS